MRTSNRWVVVLAAAGAAVGLVGAAGWLTQAAAAPGGCGSLPAGNAVFVNCVQTPATTPYSTYSDGQQVDLAMGPNSMFSGQAVGGDIEAIECEYSTGTTPGDPPDANFCSAQTLAGGFPYAVHTNGSFDYAVDQHGDSVTVFALPDATLSGATITCNPAHPCVWYVGENYNDFKAPHVFSNPFVVTSSAASPGSTPTTVAAPTSGTAPAPGAGTAGSVPGQLAYTGPTSLPVWTAAVGFVLVALGLVGRRLLLRGSQ